jgi:hypothetical protein
MPDPTPAQTPAPAPAQPAAQPSPAASAPHQPNPAPASAAVTATAPAPAQVPNTPPKAPKDDTPQTANKLDVPQTADQPARAPVKPGKDEKPQTLYQKLADIRNRVETAAMSRVFEGKAEAFADAWADLDAIGEADPNKPHEAAMIQAAHNHLQHHAPRRASELDALERQLDEATDAKPRPQAVPDSPQLAHVKARIAALQTDLARDPRALPDDKERAQQLQERVDQINTEKATAGAK